MRMRIKTRDCDTKLGLESSAESAAIGRLFPFLLLFLSFLLLVLAGWQTWPLPCRTSLILEVLAPQEW